MARPLRIEFHGALYHITSRCDGREDIYHVESDREQFLEILAMVRERFNWVVHAYCLMTNYYHLLVETPDGNLSGGMRQLNGVYTQRFNRLHKRVGHVFQGRYKAILVDKDSYLLELSRYIVLNPVRAGMVRSAKDWSWSSYRDTAGLTAKNSWLETDWILSAFSRTRVEAYRQYRKFVSEGKGQNSPWDELKNQVYLGSDDFVDEMQRRVDPNRGLSEIPSAQKRAVPKALVDYERTAKNRDDAIVCAYRSGGYSMKAIGDHFGLHYSRVSRIIKKHESTMAKSKTCPFFSYDTFSLKNDIVTTNNGTRHGYFEFNPSILTGASNYRVGDFEKMKTKKS